jgi:PadR family transcriptional regulator, regulatory protein PadR
VSNLPRVHACSYAGDILQPGSRTATSIGKKEPYQNRIELLQGTLDMLILQALRWKPQHGYGIVQALRAGSDDVLQVETGSLYPALHRLERQGWIKSEWATTENNQRAKYYQVTAAGKKQLTKSTCSICRGQLCSSDCLRECCQLIAWPGAGPSARNDERPQ